MTQSAALNTARRNAELAGLAEHGGVDVLVIGGGVTGAGVALDAAARGLTVALVEKHDLAFGTSRWSSKLVHGGLRYLATGNVGIARRSAIERGILMTRNAPIWFIRWRSWCRCCRRWAGGARIGAHRISGR